MRLLLVELERCRVDAITQARRRRTVLEHMPQVRAAAFAYCFGAAHAEAIVVFRLDVCANRRLPEARPAGSRIEFMVRLEKLGTAADATVNAGVVIIPIC